MRIEKTICIPFKQHVSVWNCLCRGDFRFNVVLSFQCLKSVEENTKNAVSRLRTWHGMSFDMHLRRHSTGKGSTFCFGCVMKAFSCIGGGFERALQRRETRWMLCLIIANYEGTRKRTISDMGWSRVKFGFYRHLLPFILITYVA